MAGDIGIGRIIEDEAHRDAIHVAVAPVKAACRLWPGQRVSLIQGGQFATDDAKLPPVGIVDPFLSHPIETGTQFYMFLFPGSITSLRHEWTHPAFGDAKPSQPADVAASEKWLLDFANSLCDDEDGPMTPSRLMIAADRWVEYGEFLVERGGQSWQYALEGRERDFWHHYEVVRGVKVEEPDARFFSCSC